MGYDAVILFLDELILWLATHAADLKFLQTEGPKLVNLVEFKHARPIPVVSFVARQRDLRELVGKDLSGAEALNFADILDYWEGRFGRISLEDRNLAAIAEKRLLRPRDAEARRRLDLAVRAAIDSDKQRVVAVVVNAIDEHLAGSSQIEWTWTPEWIRPLRDLLEAAFASRRIVAIAADHGHVLHREGDYRPAPGGEARWRPDDGPAQPDEVRVAGPRVRGPDRSDRAILLWRKSSRYVKKHNGYHGGATPQEALAPLALFAPVPVPGKNPARALRSMAMIRVPSGLPARYWPRYGSTSSTRKGARLFRIHACPS
jgi:hypothetical protein